jgi:hypothetical protein
MKLLSDVTLSSDSRADGDDIIVRQFSSWMGFISRSSALFGHVTHVVGVRAKKEMGWINTRRIITAVTHFQAVWDSFVHGFPCGAMRENSCLIGAPHLAIASAIDIASPNPANIWICKRAQAFGYTDQMTPAISQSKARLRTVVPWLVSTAIKMLKFNAAVFTGAGNLGDSHVTSSGSLVRAAAMLITSTSPDHFITVGLH